MNTLRRQPPGVACFPDSESDNQIIVNDVHSRLNRTKVRESRAPSSLAEIQTAIRFARQQGLAISIAGSRHAMGTQQFATGSMLIDTRNLNHVLHFDAVSGLIEVQAGMEWPDLINHLWHTQASAQHPWAIRQKQTGADRLTVGGAASANIHGRGLCLKPFINDVEALTLVNAEGELVRCSRSQNAELFQLVIGGYGLFGVIHSVTLRLIHRQMLRRVVRVLDVEDLMPYLEERIQDGFLYGDFQFAIDDRSEDFLRRGVCSCYEPVSKGTNYIPPRRELNTADWERLLYLAHVDPRRAFAEYITHYLATDGQHYWSDTHQLTEYIDGYHGRLDTRMGCTCGSSEMITELYVPRESLASFLARATEELRRHHAKVIYGTVRLIERDEESFLAWAGKSYACIIFNLHVEHTPGEIDRNAAIFRLLIDLACSFGGSFYLTYHRFATKEQVEACYPQFRQFLDLKRRYDPAGLFQSEWYRHHVRLFGG